MPWMLQETDRRNEVVRDVRFDEKPNLFMIADYLPEVAHHTALLDVGMICLPNMHTWALVELDDTVEDPEGFGEEFFKNAMKMPGSMAAEIAVLRRVFDKRTLYMLVYDGDKHASKWLEFGLLIGRITYKPGWYFRSGIEEGRMWFQVGVTEEAEISFDPIAGKKVPWRGAKHYLSPHMCRNEIVTGVKHAIDRAEMHEVNEWFRYKGKPIYNPHLDPDALVEVARWARNFNTRENAMTMDEPA